MLALRVIGALFAALFLVISIGRYKRRQISRLSLIIGSVISIGVIFLAIEPSWFNPLFETFNFEPGTGQRLTAVVGLADHPHVGLGVDDHGEPGTDQLLVVDQEHTDHRGLPGAPADRTGSRASTAKPPPGRGPAEVDPPSTATRSRIPSSPWPPPEPGVSPYPSSVTDTTRSPSVQLSPTRAAASGPACLSTFVSDSWTSR